MTDEIKSDRTLSANHLENLYAQKEVAENKLLHIHKKIAVAEHAYGLLMQENLTPEQKLLDNVRDNILKCQASDANLPRAIGNLVFSIFRNDDIQKHLSLLYSTKLNVALAEGAPYSITCFKEDEGFHHELELFIDEDRGFFLKLKQVDTGYHAFADLNNLLKNETAADSPDCIIKNTIFIHIDTKLERIGGVPVLLHKGEPNPLVVQLFVESTELASKVQSALTTTVITMIQNDYWDVRVGESNFKIKSLVQSKIFM